MQEQQLLAVLLRHPILQIYREETVLRKGGDTFLDVNSRYSFPFLKHGKAARSDCEYSVQLVFFMLTSSL